MTRSSRLPEPAESGLTDFAADAATSIGLAISRNPILVGGATAFFVAFSYVSANALWYQPHFHDGAIIATREKAVTAAEPPSAGSAEAARQEVPVRSVPVSRVTVPLPETAPRDDVRTDAIPEPDGEATLRKVQSVLRELDLYSGEVDGLNGPQTRSAVEAYQRIVGLPETGEIDDRLLRQLGAEERTVTASAGDTGGATADTVPAPRTAADRTVADPTISRIQAGLRAFGHESMEIDGMLGSETRSAIREFQSLFGLEVTGEPNERLLAKMIETGLIN